MCKIDHISSGAAIATRLLQLIAKSKRTTNPDELDIPRDGNLYKVVQRLPQYNKVPVAGAVLLAPYVDYTQLHPHERKGSFKHYSAHDLIVNQAVQEYGLPYLEAFVPSLQYTETNAQARYRQSPIHQSFDGLTTPLFVVVSEHEAVYDQTCQLVNNARQANPSLDVTIGVWKYMCHVFTFFWGFIPEGRDSMALACQWLNEQQEDE